MKFNSFLGGCLTTLVVVAGAAFIYQSCERTEGTIQTKETTDVKVDTIPHFVDVPVPKDSIVLRYQTVTLPVDQIAKNDSADTLSADSIRVNLPITQKVYEDSIYKAWVSGYNPALDSIRIYQPVTTITHTITNTEVKYKTRRWGVGVQAGIGVTPTKVEPYIGIGVTYNIFSW